MFAMFRGLWQYRHFVLSSIRNELVSRFASSKFGAVWIVINPLSQVLIYALILSNILSARLPGIDNPYAFAIYLMAGLLAFNLFSEIISRCLTLFVDQGNLMKKVSFPRITMPVIVVGSCLLNNIILFVVMLIIFTLLGHSFSLVMLWIIPLTLMVVILAVGIGLILGVINVFMRDFGQAIPIILQVWFWFTPIVYPENIIPEAHRHLLKMNPMYSIVDAYHQILVYNTTPTFDRGFVNIVVVAILLLVLSLFMFRRASAEMVDVL